VSFAVGVDAGGTRVSAVVSLPDGSHRFGYAPAANLRAIGVDRATDAIVEAIASALLGAQAGAVAVGAAGAGDPVVAAALSAALERRFPGARVAVCDDAAIALRAGVPTGDALALIAGTGSIAYGEIGAERYRVGGHGYLLGDEGSGFAIGSAAIRLLLRAYDGRVPQDPFLAAVATSLGVGSAQETIARIYQAERPVTEIAAIAAAALDFADAGERSAAKIVQAAALELFDLVKSLVRRAGVEDRELPLLFAGGLLAKNSLLTYLIETRVSNELPHVVPRKQPPDPALGALALAQGLGDRA